MQFRISACQRFERDPASLFKVSIPSQIRTSGCKCPDQWHAVHIAQKITQAVRCTSDCGLDDLHCNRSGLNRIRRTNSAPSCFPGLLLAAKLLFTRRPAPTARCHHAPLCESRMCRTLGIEVIVRPENESLDHFLFGLTAAPSAIRFVRCSQLKNVHTSVLHLSHKTSAIAAGAVNANPLQVSEGPHPCQHQFVALPCCAKAPAFPAFGPFHRQRLRCGRLCVSSPPRTGMVCFDLARGLSFPSVFDMVRRKECTDRTVMRPDGQALPGSRGIFETKPHRKAFLGGQQAQGKTGVRSIGMRVRSHQEAKRHQPGERTTGVWVKSPETWLPLYDCRSVS